MPLRIVQASLKDYDGALDDAREVSSLGAVNTSGIKTCTVLATDQHEHPGLPPAVALAPDSRHRVCSVQCVSLKPDWGKGYSRLGAAYFGLEEWDKAIEAYDTGWSCGPVGPGSTAWQQVGARPCGHCMDDQQGSHCRPVPGWPPAAMYGCVAAVWLMCNTSAASAAWPLQV